MSRLLLLALLLAALPAAAQARAWNFRVFLDGREIGHHHFTLRTDGEARELRSEARFKVTLLGFDAYRYVHDATEHWRDDCLRSLVSSTDDNGERAAVDWRGPDGDCVMSFAYWNPAILAAQRLLNAQTGRFDPVSVTSSGEETIEVRGVRVATRRYRLAGSKLGIDLWYAGHEWVALESETSGGRRLRYQAL